MTQQSESAVRIHIYPPFRSSFPFGLPQSAEWSSLCSQFPFVVYFIHISSVYTSIPVSKLIPPPFPLGIYTFVLYLCLCFANKIICTIFLDPTYMYQYYSICFPLHFFHYITCILYCYICSESTAPNRLCPAAMKERIPPQPGESGIL